MVEFIGNREFRKALVVLNGLNTKVAGPLPSPVSRSGPAWASEMVGMLSFVQVDSVSAIERAQHQILFTRNKHYVPDDLERAVAEDRRLFEHWTHDAAILPIEFYPYWKHCFEESRLYMNHPGYRRYFAPVKAKDVRYVMDQISERGPLKPRDLGTAKVFFGDNALPAPSLAKITMEQLWRKGKLAVTRRDKREKVYDLAQRVIPASYLKAEVSQHEFIDFACRQALKRLGAATPAQIARFYLAVSLNEVNSWCRQKIGNDLVEVNLGPADKSANPITVFALADQLDFLRRPPEPSNRLRLINPFDPLIHDRQRTSRVLGFDYTLEIFVPAKKRVYGYYVLPILEGIRFTGRLDAKFDRKKKHLQILGLWWEAGINPGKKRQEQLDRELSTLARYLGAQHISFT